MQRSRSAMQVLTLFLVACTLFPSLTSAAQKTVMIYSYRPPYLIEPLIRDFEVKTGIYVDFKYLRDEIPKLLTQEGKNSRADLILVSGIGRMHELVEQGLLRQVSSTVLYQNIPEIYRDSENFWFGLTFRARPIFLSKERFKKQDLDYEDLASSRFKGRLCMRDLSHPYNRDLVAGLITDIGEAKTTQWLLGVKKNLARRTQGNDRDQIRAIHENKCDITIANSYFYGQMKQDPIQKTWADAVWMIFPNQKNRGAHVNISGIAMARYAKNIKEAQALMEYFSQNDAQSKSANLNFEFPVNKRVPISEEKKSWGAFKVDQVRLSDVTNNEEKAKHLIQAAGLD